MKQIFKLTLLMALSLSVLSSCNRIDAGHVGIKVNLYGDDKGVQDITEVTGWVWYNPFTKQVFEVPTFVQNVVYTKDESRTSRGNEEFRVTTKDGMVAEFDLSMNYLTPAENVVSIFRKYRKPVSELERGVIRTFLREGFNKIASQYTAEQLYEKRAEFESQAEEIAGQVLAGEGFIVEQIVILNEIRLPDDVVLRINDKVKAAQITKQKQEEVRQEMADAEKRIATARGDSLSMIIRANAKAQQILVEAEAKAEAYKVMKKELSPMIVQQMTIDKWDGVLPVYGAIPSLMKIDK